MGMEISWISILFGAFGLGVLQLSWEAIKFFLMRKDKLKSTEEIFKEKQSEIESLFNDLLSGAVKIQEILEEFVQDNDASRILVMKLENGGGVPQLGTIQHISVLNEAIHPDHKYPNGNINPIKQDFQNFIIGSDFQKVMMSMLTEQIYITNTSDLEDGFIKNLYIVNKTEKIIMFPVTQIPSIGSKLLKGFMIYIAIEFMDNRTVDAKLEANYTILQNKIKHIFYEFYVKRISMFN